MQKFITKFDNFDIEQLTFVEIDIGSHADANEFSDAYLCKARYKGEELIEDELNFVTDNFRELWHFMIWNPQ